MRAAFIQRAGALAKAIKPLAGQQDARAGGAPFAALDNVRRGASFLPHDAQALWRVGAKQDALGVIELELQRDRRLCDPDGHLRRANHKTAVVGVFLDLNGHGGPGVLWTGDSPGARRLRDAFWQQVHAHQIGREDGQPDLGAAFGAGEGEAVAFARGQRGGANGDDRWLRLGDGMHQRFLFAFWECGSGFGHAAMLSFSCFIESSIRREAGAMKPAAGLRVSPASRRIVAWGSVRAGRRMPAKSI